MGGSWLACVAVALAVAAGACSDTNEKDSLEVMADSGFSSSTSATAPSSSTTTTTMTLATDSAPDFADFPEPSDGEIFDEYIASQVESFAAALREAMSSPSSEPAIDHPDLSRYAADAYLEVNHEYLEDIAAEGTVVRLPEELAVGESIDERNRISPVMALDGGSLKVFRCWVQDEEFVEIATGSVEAGGVITILAEVTLQRFEDGWKAVYSVVSQKNEGVAGCFLASEADFPY